MKWIDEVLNKTTMYRLLLYILSFCWHVALLLCLFGILPFSPLSLIVSLIVLLIVAWVTNTLLALVFKVTPNIESSYISAFILSLLITPELTQANLIFMVVAAALAMASKYLLAYRRKHFFNPVAIAGVITTLTINQSFSWWVGSSALLPFVVIGGFLIVRKIHRADLVVCFLLVALGVIALSGLATGTSPLVLWQKTLLYSPILFFASVMLAEPLTTPPTRALQIAYGVVVGLLFSPQIHFGSFYITPELALVLGNIFSYAVSPKARFALSLEKIEKLGGGVHEFLFRSDRRMAYQAGQYIEWTLGVSKPDTRGNRRYFTIASSPTEETVHFGIKFYPKPSRFKAVLADLKPGAQIFASQLSGSFTLPKDPKQKLVFIAGGIGVTPFRSQVKYLIDTKDSRDVVLFYSNNEQAEIAFADIFTSGEAIGLRTVYTLTDKTKLPATWKGSVGYVDAEMIKKELPDYQERLFYVSGPHSMVVAIEKQLHALGISRTKIKTDYFPGYA